VVLLGDFKLGDDVKAEALRTMTNILTLTLNNTVCLPLMPTTTLESLATASVLINLLLVPSNIASGLLGDDSGKCFGRFFSRILLPDSWVARRCPPQYHFPVGAVVLPVDDGLQAEPEAAVRAHCSPASPSVWRAPGCQSNGAAAGACPPPGRPPARARPGCACRVAAHSGHWADRSIAGPARGQSSSV
jgi:hypothetical protein